MSIPLLTTKLNIPPQRPDHVPRLRLIDRLNHGLQVGRKLTLISAPAGFGKTSLIGEWLAARKGSEPNLLEPDVRIAWLSLDEADGDLARFLAYLVGALQTAAPDLGKRPMAALQSSQQPPAELLLTDLLNEIAAASDSFVLVLDDYHLIDARSVDDALTFLLEHMPPGLHLVITTREDPQLPVARLRARGQLTELRAADLRFTAGEADQFLNTAMGLDLSSEEIAALETRTEGWAAGLQLAALSMLGRGDVSRFIQAFAGDHRYVVDYLGDEVLHRQPEPVRNFLLQTSILDRLNGPLCDAVRFGKAKAPSTATADAVRLGKAKAPSTATADAVRFDPDEAPTGVEDGSALLVALERGNLFLIPLDDRRHWYRYHHLFADVLRAHLLEEQPDQVPILHRRASVWFEENGSAADAIHHALAAEDFERAARLIELAWSDMDRSRQSATWLGWAEALPDQLVRARPVLSVGFAWALLDGGKPEAAAARLRDAERWLDIPSDQAGRSAGIVVDDEEEFGSLPATIATARAYHAQALGDMLGSVKHARRALHLLPEDDHLRRGIAGALLGLAIWTGGDLEAAHRAFAAARTDFESAGNVLFAITGTYILANIRMAQGRLREAIDTYEQSLTLATEQGGPVQRGTAELHLGLSDLLRERGDLEAADRHRARSEELGEQAALPRWRYHWCLAQARLKETQGDLDSALDLLHEAERRYIRGPVPDVRPVAALKARVWIGQGRWTKALDWAREQGLSVDGDLSYLREFEHATLARALIARFKSERVADAIRDALQLIDRLLQAAEAEGRTGSVIDLLLLQALAHEAQDDAATALTSLERALALAQPEGYVRTFAAEGRPMARLLSAASSRGIRPHYVAKLLAAIDGEDTPYQPEDQPLVEPLSARELEVLQLIAQGLSNREIGERLCIALSTVKGHNRNIYGKLHVQRRTEAVARARELGLL